MPYKCENVRLGNYDRRRKLTNEDKEKIKEKYATGLYSQRALAREYCVSHSLIGIIVNPVRAEHVKQRMKDHWQEYSNREKLTEATRNKRRYKAELYKKGLIKEEKENV